MEWRPACRLLGAKQVSESAAEFEKNYDKIIDKHVSVLLDRQAEEKLPARLIGEI